MPIKAETSQGSKEEEKACEEKWKGWIGSFDEYVVITGIPLPSSRIVTSADEED